MNYIKNSESLKEELTVMTKVLAEQLKKREYDAERIVLENIVDKTKDCSEELCQLRKQRGHKVSNTVAMICDEIINAANGVMSVPHYSHSQKSEQDVFVYDGMRWKKIDNQTYNDFVRKAARKAGMSEMEVGTPSIMEQLGSRLAYNVSNEWHPYVSNNMELINMRNGTLELMSDGRVNLRPHEAQDYICYVLTYSYDPEAQCPMFQAFLDKVIPNKDTQKTLLMFIGYCFTRNIKLEKMLLLHGGGSNGKSVLLEIVSYLVGVENTTFESLSDLTLYDEKRAQIENRLVNISTETGARMDHSMYKKLVSGEAVSVRALYRSSHTMYRYTKFISSCNTTPRAEYTYGFSRRLVLLPMRVTIKENEADLELTEKLKTELPGIFNLVLKALQEFINDGYRFFESDECRKAKDHYMMQGDSVRLFLEECCEMGYSYGSAGKMLYEEYRKYCNEIGMPFKGILGKQNFFQRMTECGVKRSGQSNRPMFDVRIAVDNGY